MGISKKSKRVVTSGSKKYFWWIFDEWDQSAFDGIQVKIVPESQEFYIKYGIQQNDEERFVVISLRENKSKIHLYCPKFENNDQILSNSGVKNIISWCKKALSKNDAALVRHAYKSREGIIKIERFHEIFTEIFIAF